MESENTDIKKRAISLDSLRAVGNTITDAGKYALFLALVLIGIWFVGRIFAAFSHNTVFEPILTYCMALSVWILLGVFVFGAAIHCAPQLIPYLRRRNVLISWVFFGLLGAAILYIIQGYRVASMGLFAIMSGLTEPARQSFFQLFKFFPVTPMLPINLVAAKAMGLGLEIDSLMPFVWRSSYILMCFVWSLVYGALLLRMQGGKFLKVVHLALSLAGLIIMMTLKSLSIFTKEQLIFLQMGVLILFFLQVLLTYSSLRVAARGKNEDMEETDPIPLPPTAFKVALFLLLILPILADLQNQFVLVSNSRPILQELASDQSKDQAQYVTVTQISIHSGPAVGDDVVGILPKGTLVHVFEKKYGWVCIGVNSWVSSKFLSPAQTG